MAVLEGTIFSYALGKETHLTVILPQDTRSHTGFSGVLANGMKPHTHPHTMILMHGYTDCDTSWVRKSSLERYAEAYDMAIVMPDGETSFYNNMTYGPRFFDYITEELPQLASNLFQLSVDPENLYIGGLSMGGYGALLCALTYPERYAACAAFSSAADLRGIADSITDASMSRDMEAAIKGIFGDPPVLPDSSDLFQLAQKVQTPIRIFMTCGRQDFTYPANIKFRDAVATNPNILLQFEEWDGTHEWGFWDTSIAMFFKKYIQD